jgi:kynurenine formamidase
MPADRVVAGCLGRAHEQTRPGPSGLGLNAVGPWPVGQNEAGYHASVAPWLKERGVSFLGADDAQDVTPSLVEGINLPVHTLAITALGIDILDNQDLEAVAEMAAKLKRWEFLLTTAPVPVTGGTGFPVNALAIF